MGPIRLQGDWLLWAAILGSLTAHVAVGAMLPEHRATVSREPQWQDLEVVTPPLPVESEPEPEPEPAPEAEPDQAEPEPQAAATNDTSDPADDSEPSADDSSPEESEPETAAAPEPVELDGTTLTNEGGDGPGWSAPKGSNKRRSGALRAPRAGKKRARRGKNKKKGASGKGSGAVAAAEVPFKDLSSKPHPPGLSGILRRYYPADARRRGIGGQARVRIRIAANGRARGVAVLSETYPGFGQACLQTVAGSTWGAPRDANGRAVATWVSYRCHFRVDR